MSEQDRMAIERPDLDGARLTTPGSAEVWLVMHGRRRRVASAAVYDSLFSDCEGLQPCDDIDAIALGPELTSGSCLVKARDGLSIYLATGVGREATLSHIVSYESLLAFGFDLAKVREVPALLLNALRRGAPLQSAHDRSVASVEAGGDVDPAVIARIVQAPPADASLRPGDPVVVCTHGLPPGGAERQWVYLAQALKALGYAVTFVVYDGLSGDNAHYLPLLERAGIPVVVTARTSLSQQFRAWSAEAPISFDQLGAVPSPDQLLALADAFRALKPRAVFLQLDHCNVVGALAAHLAGIPRMVLSFRNYNPMNFPYLANDWFLPCYQALVGSPRVLLTGNHRGANDDYADWIGIPPERIVHVPNAIDPEAFAAPDASRLSELRAELGLGASTPVILGAFRLSAEKDPLLFIEVCARAMAAIPATRAFVAGVGPMREAMERRIDALGLTGRVTLLGRREDVNVLMAMASVFLLTSEREGMPNVVLEAQLMGAPVVATRSGGTPDTVIDATTARLFDVGDLDGLATACIDLLTDRAAARRMGEAGRAHVLASFPKALLGERYRDVVLASV